MADDFIVEEESSNRTFLYAAGGLGALLLLGLIAIVVIALTGRNTDGDNEIAIMNMTIEAQNALVTQTVAAMETIAAYTPTPSRVAPTAVPTKIPTFTPSPAPPTATPSPVAQTPIAEGTSVAEAAAPTGSPTPTAGPSGGELPASGMGMWGAIGAAVALIAVILIARRLRPAV